MVADLTEKLKDSEEKLQRKTNKINKLKEGSAEAQASALMAKVEAKMKRKEKKHKHKVRLEHAPQTAPRALDNTQWQHSASQLKQRRAVLLLSTWLLPWSWRSSCCHGQSTVGRQLQFCG